MADSGNPSPDHAGDSIRRRRFGLLAAAALIVGGVLLYLVLGSSDGDENGVEPASAVGGGEAELAGSELMARAVDKEDPHVNGRLLVIKGGQVRQLEGSLACERVYYAGGRGLCLESTGIDGEFGATIFDSSLEPLATLPLDGLPSRARVSDDGRYGAMTSFVNGHGYEGAGGFSTATVIVDMQEERALANLEDFSVKGGGRQVDPEDTNFWGVTFAPDSDRFYATLRSGDRYLLVRGDIPSRTLRVVRAGLECPSLSPDASRIAYKSRIGTEDRWRLEVLDLDTMKAHRVAEPRSIDDQVEWLDDSTLVYSDGLDVFTAPADGSGPSRMVLHDATSPVSLRTGGAPASKPMPNSKPEGEG